MSGLGGGGAVGNLGLNTLAGRLPPPHCPLCGPHARVQPVKQDPTPRVSQREGILRSHQQQREQKVALRDPETRSSARPQQVGSAAGTLSQGTKHGKKVQPLFLRPHLPPAAPTGITVAADSSPQGGFRAERRQEETGWAARPGATLPGIKPSPRAWDTTAVVGRGTARAEDSE